MVDGSIKGGGGGRKEPRILSLGSVRLFCHVDSFVVWNERDFLSVFYFF